MYTDVSKELTGNSLKLENPKLCPRLYLSEKSTVYIFRVVYGQGMFLRNVSWRDQLTHSYKTTTRTTVLYIVIEM
jgi:hypothetical protein